MKVTNISRKVISILGKTLLPGEGLRLESGDEDNPNIQFYLRNKILSINDAVEGVPINPAIGEGEREKIAREAVEKYKQEQEAYNKQEEAKESKIRAIKSMKKKENLIKMAIGMGLEFADSDTADMLKEKIINAVNA